MAWRNKMRKANLHALVIGDLSLYVGMTRLKDTLTVDAKC